jgi:hypothetical protein
VWILEVVFHRSEGESVQIMLHVHNNGVASRAFIPLTSPGEGREGVDLAEQNEFPPSTLEPNERTSIADDLQALRQHRGGGKRRHVPDALEHLAVALLTT